MNVCLEAKNSYAHGNASSSKNEKIICVGLDVLAEVAVITNFITGDEYDHVNISNLQSTRKNGTHIMHNEIENGASEICVIERKSADVDECKNQKSSVVTDMEFSDQDQDDVEDDRIISYAESVKTNDDAKNRPISHSLPCVSLGNEINNSRSNIFVSMLMDVLSSKSMENLITWLPEGNAFIIINEEEFTKYILPVCFELINFETFIKKLYLWGFRSMNPGQNNKAFYREYFLRDFPSLCSKISQDNVTVDPVKTIGMVNIKRKLNYLALEDMKPNYLNSVRITRTAQTFGRDCHSRQRQLQLRSHQRRSASMIHTSNAANFNNTHANAFADTLVKNFFDRKMNRILSQYLQTPLEYSNTRKSKRLSMGL